MGHHRRPPAAPSVGRRGDPLRAAAASDLRRGLLPLSGQQPRRRPAQPCVSTNVRVRQRPAVRRDGRRLLAENDSAIAFVPYFARYAYETYVAPKETHPSIATLSRQELIDLAAVLKQVLARFDNLWRMSFPYVMLLHPAPTDGGRYPGIHFHIEFHPPLRAPTLLKYLAGPEIGGGNFLSDTSPEEKAAELRAASVVHYKQAGLGHAAGR